MAISGNAPVRWYKKLDGNVVLQYAREVYTLGNVRRYDWVDVPVVEEVVKGPEPESEPSIRDYAKALAFHLAMADRSPPELVELIRAIFTLKGSIFAEKPKASLEEAVAKVYENVYQTMHSVTDGFTQPVMLTKHNAAGQQTRLMHGLETQYPDWTKRTVSAT